jgi:cell wall assembly regulator SMI1
MARASSSSTTVTGCRPWPRGRSACSPGRGSPLPASHSEGALARAWQQVESLLRSRGALALFALKPPASAADLESLQQHLGLALPASFVELLQLHDGQEDAARCGLFFGDPFLSVAGIRLHWDNWMSLADDGLDEEFAGAMSSDPPGAVKPLYLDAKWIPFTHDGGGNHSAIDLDPDTGGRMGQVIAFGRDLDEKRVLASSLEDFCARFLRHLESVAWSLDKGWWDFADPAFRKHYHGWF